MNTVVLINPKAGNGKSIKIWNVLRKKVHFLKPFSEKNTKYPGHMTELVRAALKQGVERLLVVGGDGSLSEALNGFFEDGKLINPSAMLGGLPLGSGSDFLKTLGIKDVSQALSGLKKNRTKLCDIGEIHFRDLKKREQKKYVLNISSFGCAGEIVNRVNQSNKIFGAKVSYFSSMFSTFLTYKNPQVELQMDSDAKRQVAINNVFVCNGQYSGGGMMWGPKASLTDGVLDITIVTTIPKLQGLLNMNKIYNGRVLEFDGIEMVQCKRFSATSTESVPIEVDGDIAGTLPATYVIHPKKLLFWY